MPLVPFMEIGMGFPVSMRVPFNKVVVFFIIKSVTYFFKVSASRFPCCMLMFLYVS